MIKRSTTLFLLAASFCVYHQPYFAADQASTECTQENTQVWLNFFVHGIMSINPHLNLNNFLRFMRDDVENTTYEKTVEFMRQDEHFYKNQAMQNFGLIKIDPTVVEKGNASAALARILDQVTLLSHGPCVENHYYTYGWRGLLSPTNRYKDAIGLYKKIEEEISYFIKRGITPKIRVIGYSHGGNVVLNLAAVRIKENVRKDLKIEQTILLGMPVQSETDYLVKDELFEKVYHIYSNGDRVQKLDFFSYNRIFSRRTFNERPGFKLPSKLVQIQLKLVRSAPKTRKNKKKFELTYNFKNPAIVSGKSHLLKDSSPGHLELWFFGWTPAYYRPTFSLSPLPTVAILPFILKTVQEIEHLLTPHHPVIFDMRPEHGITIIKNVRDYKFYNVVDFIDVQTFKKLQAIALEYAPDTFTHKEYNNRINQAYLKAHEFYQKEMSVKARRRRRLSLKKEELKARNELKKTQPAAHSC